MMRAYVSGGIWHNEALLMRGPKGSTGALDPNLLGQHQRHSS